MLNRLEQLHFGYNLDTAKSHSMAIPPSLRRVPPILELCSPAQNSIIANVTDGPTFGNSVDLLAAMRSGDITALVRAISLIQDAADGVIARLSSCASIDSSALKLDHIGIAVRSIEADRALSASLGIAMSHQETVETEQVRTVMLPLSDTRIELLEPIAEDSTVGRFLTRRGEGLHHIAVRADDIDEMFHRLATGAVRLASDAIRVGSGGHRYFFIHPASSGGMLVEVVGGSSSHERAQ